MLPLYRALLIGFLALVVVSYVQGARSKGASGFLWACTGTAIFIAGLVVFGIAINAMTPGNSAIDTLASTLTLTCAPFLVALYARAKLLPGSPLFSLPRRIPVVPVSVVTVGSALLLIAHQIDRSILFGIVRVVLGPAEGGRAGQLETMTTVANVRGALLLITIAGLFLIGVHFAIRSRRTGS